jgi:hypothetical protein
MKKEKNLPNGYFTLKGVPTHNLLRVWMIFEHLYPRFKRRAETISSKMINDVLDVYFKVSPIEEIMPDYNSIWFQLTYGYASYTTKEEGYVSKYKKYDEMIVKYMF